MDDLLSMWHELGFVDSNLRLRSGFTQIFPLIRKMRSLTFVYMQPRRSSSSLFGQYIQIIDYQYKTARRIPSGQSSKHVRGEKLVIDLGLRLKLRVELISLTAFGHSPPARHKPPRALLVTIVKCQAQVQRCPKMTPHLAPP
jgi:hypothetical protein